MSQHQIVSADTDALILVDAADQVLGSLDKASCHDGAGILHRAFSLFVLNSQHELLIQQRHASKRLWPGYWANSCCSHPRVGEEMSAAVVRRAQEELGLQVQPDFIYKFEYQASFGTLGAEHELCWVFLARSDAQPSVNLTEIQDWRWISPDALDKALASHSLPFTPWLELEWQTLRCRFNHLIAAAK